MDCRIKSGKDERCWVEINSAGLLFARPGLCGLEFVDWSRAEIHLVNKKAALRRLFKNSEGSFRAQPNLPNAACSLLSWEATGLSLVASSAGSSDLR